MSLHEIYSYALLTKREVKWLDIGRVFCFFVFAFLGTETKSWSKKKEKKNEANIQSS